MGNEILVKSDLEEIVSRFNIGRLLDYEYFESGTVQINILIRTEYDRYVLRYYQQGRLLESVYFELELINFLYNHGFPCPYAIMDRDGAYAGTHMDKPIALFTYIEGSHIVNPDKLQEEELVKKTAELSVITRSFQSEYKQFRFNYNPESIMKALTKKIGEDPSKPIYEKFKWFRNEMYNLNLYVELPLGVCHCDFHFTNILYKNNEFQALIDFDDANYTYLMLDLVLLIDSVIFKFNWKNWRDTNSDECSLDFESAKNIIAIYNSIRPLNELEMKHIFDLLKFCILIDCLWYFDRGDLKSGFYEQYKISLINSIGRNDFYNFLKYNSQIG